MTSKTLQVHSDVQQYYGKELESNRDLKTTACCNSSAVPDHLKDALSKIHIEIHEKFYGCGSPIPLALDGCTVLDLGCGTGRDSYVVSSLVGQSGHVIGIDMTDEQIAVARQHVDFHMKQFGFNEPNIEFRKGLIEDLAASDIADNSIDVVISNCVLNLSPDKPQVFKELLRVLKPGGELYFSDVFAGSRISATLKQDPVLHGECLSGALYVEDFRRLLLELGINDFRIVAGTPIHVTDPEIALRIGDIDFYSLTVRAFNVAGLEDAPEDYGQFATYIGGLPESPHFFELDQHTVFRAGKPTPVSGNTAAILSESRFAHYFTVSGSRSKHFGPFEGAEAQGFSLSTTEDSDNSCC